MASRNSYTTYAGKDIIYFNADVYNPGPDFMECVFDQTLSTSILDNPSDYYVSLIRFNIPGSNVSVFNFNTTTNYYTVTLSYNGSDYRTALIYIPDNTQGENTVYSYQRFLDMANVALSSSFTALKLANPGAPAINPPVMIYDAVTQLISILTPTTGYIGIGATTIFFNENLNAFFESFMAVFNGIGSTNGKDVQITVEDTGNNTLYVQAPGANANGVFYSTSKLPATTYYKMTQEFSTLYLWNELQNIVIQSSGVPIVSEYLPQVNGVVNMFPIMSDFQPLVNQGPEVRSNYQYLPSAQYRLINLQSNTPLDKIGLRALERTQDGTLRPILISPHKSASFKLAFIRKGAGYQTYRNLEHGGQFEKTHLIEDSYLDVIARENNLLSNKNNKGSGFYRR